MGEGTPTMNGTFHHRPLSGLSENNTPNHVSGHSRNLSDDNNSIISDVTTGGDGRNSMALDSLASELETLRSHWETTKNYRTSEGFDFERTPTASSSQAGPSNSSGDYGSLASWRRGLDVTDEEDKSRPTTSDGPSDTTKGEAVTTPTQRNMI